MRKFYWYLTAYLRKHGLIFAISLILAIFIFSFFIPSIAKLIQHKKTHYVGVIGAFTLSNLPDIIKYQISAGLTAVNDDGSVSPRLAKRWTIEQEGTAYRFVLQDDVVWQDGKKLEPEDINYQLPGLETITTSQDIVFKLPSVYSPFPIQVAEPIFREGELPGWRINKKPTLIGIGSYKITDYQQSKSQKLSQLTVENSSEKYIYRFYLTESEVITAFKRGEVDIIPDLTRKTDISNWPTVETTQQLNFDQYLAVFFNHRDPIFQKNIRQALAYATPKPNDITRALGPIHPQSWAYLAGGKAYDFDMDRAVERLLDEPPQTALQLELTTTSLFADQAETIKNQWQKLGELASQKCQNDSGISDKNLCENMKMNIQLRVTNFPDVNNFQMLLLGQETSPDPDQYDFWHSSSEGNITGYKNTRIDNLLEKGRQTYQKQERKEIYQEFQQFLLEDVPAIFIQYIPTYTVERI